jgi:hypothetical protein
MGARGEGKRGAPRSLKHVARRNFVDPSMRIPAGSCPCSRIARPDEPIEYFSEKFGDVVRPVNGYVSTCLSFYSGFRLRGNGCIRARNRRSPGCPAPGRGGGHVEPPGSAIWGYQARRTLHRNIERHRSDLATIRFFDMKSRALFRRHRSGAAPQPTRDAARGRLE